MFTTAELNMIDREYFTVIDTEDNVITLVSKNTHHGWHIYRPDFLSHKSRPIIIFHRHENQSEYHKHTQVKTLSNALRHIRQHDTYQINVRWRGSDYEERLKKVRYLV